jgi:hypothetical protein
MPFENDGRRDQDKPPESQNACLAELLGWQLDVKPPISPVDAEGDKGKFSLAALSRLVDNVLRCRLKNVNEIERQFSQGRYWASA